LQEHLARQRRIVKVGLSRLKTKWSAA